VTEIESLRQDKKQLEIENKILREEVERLRHWRFGRKSEQLDPAQLSFFPGENPPAQTQQPKKKHKGKKKGHGRAPFPDSLPREEITCDLDAADQVCSCCGLKLNYIGDDVTERGYWIPAQMVVRQYVKRKYACPKGHEVKTAAGVPPALIDKCKYDTSVYAHIAVQKFSDHLPLNRQETIFKRYGIKLPRSTMWEMLTRVSELLRPVLMQMKTEILEESYLKADETPVRVVEQGKKGVKQGYFWGYQAGQKVMFHFTETRRGRDGPQTFLKEWKGKILQTDGYSGYDEVVSEGGLIRAGCWAHARRRFKEASDQGSGAALELLLVMKRLYWLESAMRKRAACKGLDHEGVLSLRARVRDRRSRVVVSKIQEMVRMLANQPSLLPKSLLGKAVGYWLNQVERLLVFLDHPEVEIDNNGLEREIRSIAVGRKNWMFTGSARGGRVASELYSLMNTCRAMGVNAERYLADVLERLATTKSSEVAELTPWAWLDAQASSS
jgi:transposase